MDRRIGLCARLLKLCRQTRVPVTFGQAIAVVESLYGNDYRGWERRFKMRTEVRRLWGIGNHSRPICWATVFDAWKVESHLLLDKEVEK